ncbi:MAG: VCBS repeat-containing protein, partial [Planctomycetota bacterium]
MDSLRLAQASSSGLTAAARCAAVLTLPLAVASAQRVPVEVDEPARPAEATPPAQAQPAPTDAAALRRSALHWADWSGDGLVDAWAVQPDGTGLLLENDGEGRFVDRTKSAGLGEVDAAHAAAWADVDGDGLLDLYLASHAGRSALFVQASAGDFVDVTGSSELTKDDRPIEARFLDFDADGTADLHLVTDTEDVLYRGLGRARFERVDLGLLPARTVTGIVSGGFTGAPARPAAPVPTVGSSATVGSVTPGTAAAAGSPAAICASTIVDQATGSCISASSTPGLGQLYPLTSDLFVEAGTGRVGLGTTAPGARLDVLGTARADTFTSTVGTGTQPIQVSSSTKVDNLNVDQLDGFDSTDFLLAGSAIGGGQIADGTIFDVDVAASAAIQGTKIDPDFGSQPVTTIGGVASDRTFVEGTSGVSGSISSLEVYGFAGLAADDALIVNNAPDWTGLDIGLAGISLGGSVTDNYGVLGHSNNAGVRGENSVLPQQNFGELGRDGVGVFGRGVDFAAQFEGKVDITSQLSGALNVSSDASGRVATIEHTDGGSALSVFSTGLASTSVDTCFNANSQNRGITALIQSSNLDAILPVMRVVGFANNTNRITSQVQRNGTSTGAAFQVDVTSNLSAANGINAVLSGTGTAGLFDSQSGLALDANRRTNSGTILQARNSTDVEFRVDSSGDVFADLAFNGGGADYAEWLELRDPTEELAPGDVVGVFAGQVSKKLEGADTLLVVSTNPVLVGNAGDAETTDREGHAIIAFLGQVPVRCRGAVRAGDFLIPSDLEDGTAVAVAPEDLLPDDFDRVLGRAWGSSDGRGVAAVNAAVGLDRGAVAKAAL